MPEPEDETPTPRGDSLHLANVQSRSSGGVRPGERATALLDLRRRPRLCHGFAVLWYLELGTIYLGVSGLSGRRGQSSATDGLRYGADGEDVLVKWSSATDDDDLVEQTMPGIGE